MLIVEVNGETGEVVEREATAAEVKQAEVDAVMVERAVASAAAVVDLRAAALAKLLKLGLTEGEAAALFDLPVQQEESSDD